MKRSLFVCLLLLVLAGGCGGKKEQDNQNEAREEQTFELGSCPVARIEISPQRVTDPECVIKSGCTIPLAATAYDHSGNRVDPPLYWRFRRNDLGDDKSAGTGHRLEVKGNHRAVFHATGIASSLFTVVAEDRSCNLTDDDQPMYVNGQSWIVVYPPEESPVVCGRMRVTYGDQQDRLGDKIIASAKALLIAEVSADQELGYHYRVRFYINGKPYPLDRPLYRDLHVVTEPPRKVGHKGLLPIHLTPGEFKVRYELLHNGEVVCGSRIEEFSAK